MSDLSSFIVTHYMRRNCAYIRVKTIHHDIKNNNGIFQKYGGLSLNSVNDLSKMLKDNRYHVYTLKGIDILVNFHDIGNLTLTEDEVSTIIKQGFPYDVVAATSYKGFILFSEKSGFKDASTDIRNIMIKEEEDEHILNIKYKKYLKGREDKERRRRNKTISEETTKKDSRQISKNSLLIKPQSDDERVPAILTSKHISLEDLNERITSLEKLDERITSLENLNDRITSLTEKHSEIEQANSILTIYNSVLEIKVANLYKNDKENSEIISNTLIKINELTMRITEIETLKEVYFIMEIICLFSLFIMLLLLKWLIFG